MSARMPSRPRRAMMPRLKSLLRHPLRWSRVWLGRRARPSNVERWGDLSNFDTKWDERTRLLADWASAYVSIIEFGCGRGTLSKLLPAASRYVGSDIVDRDGQTLVWDLNDGAPPLSERFDLVIFSGVLEYVLDPSLLISGLKPHTSAITASYASIDEVPDPLVRAENGWVNHLDRAGFLDLFSRNGYRLLREQPWTDSHLYLFESDG